MNTDLISALAGSVSEQAPTEVGDGDARGEFPNVLRSTLDEAEGSDRDGSVGEDSTASPRLDADGEGDRSSQDRSEAASDPESAPATGENQASPPLELELEVPDETLEAAEIGIAAAVLIAQPRTGESARISIGSDGSIVGLAAEESDPEGADRGRPGFALQNESGAIGSNERVAPDVAETLGLDKVETEFDGKAEATATTAIETALAAPSPSEAGDRSDLNRPAQKSGRAGSEVSGTVGVGLEVEGPELERASDPAESRSGDRDSERSPSHAQESAEAAESEQALFDRAAEGAQSAGVDAGLKLAAAQVEASQRAPDTVPIEGAGIVANPVAGAVTEMTTTTTPGTPTPAAASDAIAVQTEWLASRGGGTARLLLNPPDLGEIAIRVTLRNGAVDVVMVAHEALARSVAEDQSDRLAQAFSSRDLRMENFEIGRGDPQDIAGLDLSQFDDSGARGRDRAEDEESGRGTFRASGRPGEGAATDIDRSVQPEILSVGPETGVDLRI